MINLQTRRTYPPDLNEDDSGEEVDLNGGVPGSTTTVTMFDQDLANPSERKQGNDQGEDTERLFFRLESEALL